MSGFGDHLTDNTSKQLDASSRRGPSTAVHWIAMAKRWVLETHTKGTGANMVPLDDEQQQPARKREPEPVFVHPPTRPRPPKAPEPPPPRRFRIVDVTTRQALADDAGTREALAALRDVHSSVDVAISVWNENKGRYRLLTHDEQQAMWAMRDARPAAR
jgi:hypothetical protein